MKGKEPGLKANQEITKHLDGFGAWPVVKLAVVEGDVLGGGIEWLARFDFRWSTPSALFAFWQRRIGLSTGWGGGAAWAKIIGEERVRRLLLEGQLLSATAALRFGIVDRIVSGWKIRESVTDWITDLDQAAVAKMLGWSAKKERAIFSRVLFSSKPSVTA